MFRPLPDHLRDKWHKAYEWWTVQPAPAQYVDQFQRFIDQAGMTDRLIVAVIERSLERKRRHPLAWVQQVLAGLVPYGVTTPDEWVEFERQQDAEEAQQLQQRAAAKAQAKMEAAPKKTPTAFTSLQAAMARAVAEEEANRR